MGFIEEGRQLFQDFVAPEIRAIDARLCGVEKRIESLESKIDRNHAQVEKKMDSLDTKIEHAQELLESKVERNHAEVMGALHRMENYTLLTERLARVEAKLQSVA
jgi:wobble nucleotide-excising tRNase